MRKGKNEKKERKEGKRGEGYEKRRNLGKGRERKEKEWM